MAYELYIYLTANSESVGFHDNDDNKRPSYSYLTFVIHLHTVKILVNSESLNYILYIYICVYHLFSEILNITCIQKKKIM